MSHARERSFTRESLMEKVWEAPLGAVAAQIGMSANGLAKLCDRLVIPRPQRRYWNLSPAERGAAKPDLPPPPPGAREAVCLDEPRHSLRARTRMSPNERREQLLDTAAAIILSEGVGEVSLNRVAREVGISEAQAHNCCGRRIDLLVDLARRELAAIEASRRGAISRGDDLMTSVVLSTLSYLEEAETRGPLLQALLVLPEVRLALREEQAELRREARRPVLASMRARYGMTEGEARTANAMLAAVSVRGGEMLANGRAGNALVTRLCLSIILAGVRSNAEAPPSADDGGA